MRKIVGIILLVLSVSLNAQVRTDLRAHYSFEESATAFIDSINSHDASLSGTVTNGSTDVKLGDYASFPGGTGNYAELDTISLNNKSFTISAWTYIATAQGNRAVVGRWYGQTMISTNSGGTQWQLQLNTNTWSSVNMPVTTGAWKHLVWTYDGNAASQNIKFYINGSQVFTAKYTQSINNNDKNWQIGANGNNSYNFLGKIDELSIWDRAISGNEIDSIYNYGSPAYPYQWTPTSDPADPPYTGLLAFLSGDTVSIWSSIAGGTVSFYRSGFVAPAEPITFSGGDYYLSNHADSTYNTTAALEALASQLEAGDTVMIERGSVFYECDLDFSGVSGSSGNKIVFMAYGTGDDPVISGGKDLSGGFSVNGNVWTHADIGYTRGTDVHNPAGLLINDKFYAVGRYPDTRPYLETQESNTNDQFTDFPNSLGWTTDELVGAQVAARVVNWVWFVENITSNTGNTINFTTFPQRTKYESPGNDWYSTHYFLQNHKDFLSLNGEWSYDDSELNVYYTLNLNSQDVELPVTDVMITFDNSNYYEFNDIEFRGANKILINLQNSDDVDFDGCTFRIANVGLDMDYADDCDITNSTFEYLHTNGITMANCGQTYVTDNDFDWITAVRGMSNVYDDWEAAVAQKEQMDTLYVRYNTFDTVFQAFQSHNNWNSNSAWYFQYNVVNSYGYIAGDGGATYSGGDNYNTTKKITSNIFLNAINNEDMDNEQDGSHAGRHVHAIYWDYDAKNIDADSNLIVNANSGIYSNRSQGNSATANTFINASKDNSDQYAADIFLDQTISVGQYPIQYYEFTNNLHVFGNNPDQKAFGFHENSSCALTNGCEFTWLTMTMDNNEYQDPFNYANYKLFQFIEQYNASDSLNLSEFNTLTGKEGSSTFQPLLWNIDSVSVDADNFIKYVYNNSKATDYVQIGDTLNYYDIDKNTHSDSIQLAPYKHKVLFFKEN